MFFVSPLAAHLLYLFQGAFLWIGLAIILLPVFPLLFNVFTLLSLLPFLALGVIGYIIAARRILEFERRSVKYDG